MIHVIKADGTREEYSEDKIVSSMKRAGIPSTIQAQALRTVNGRLHDNIPTFDIYNNLAREIKEVNPASLSKYSLKQGIMSLGPTGYPFEDFIGKIYEELGYSALTRQILEGKCVKHETDVILEKDGRKILIEAKYHNKSGTRSDVKVALYVKARFDDLKEIHKFDEVWIVTNTKTTTDANAYAMCSGINIISWNYPNTRSLREIIEESNLYPITVLNSLNLDQKARLLAHHVILCKDLKQNPKLLDILLPSPDQKRKVMSEINFICATHPHIGS